MNQTVTEQARSLQARSVAARKLKKGRNKARPDHIRSMLNVNQAAFTVNAALSGTQKVTEMQFKAAQYILDKFVPSLKAVAMQVSQTPSLKRADLEARMLSIGLDPAAFWQMIASNPENVPANVIEHEGGQPDSVAK